MHKKSTIWSLGIGLLLLSSVSLGALLISQYALFQYFYASKVTDLLTIALFMISGGVMSFLYYKPSVHTRNFLSLLFLLFAAFTPPVSYNSYHIIDLISVLTYFMAFFGAGIIVSFLHSKPQWDSFLTFVFFIFGGFIQYFYTKLPLLFFISFVGFGLFIIMKLVSNKIKTAGIVVFILAVQLVIYLFSLNDIHFFDRQTSYYDKVIFSFETPFQHIDVTEWRGNKWFYYNNINQFSTIDEWLYHEPLVHPVFGLAASHANILVIGGENGMAIKEINKYKLVNNIDHIILDSALNNLAKTEQLFLEVNNNALAHPNINVIHEDVFTFLNKHAANYDIIIVDIPDPVDIELNQYYTSEFYALCNLSLAKKGIFITQAGSPYFATQAFYCISSTIQSANFEVLELHNQVLTLGEWGWIIGTKHLSKKELREKATALRFDGIQTHWLNNEAMKMMISFGKIHLPEDSVHINRLKKPIVQKLYTKGTWKF